jgi:hypothetical protein
MLLLLLQAMDIVHPWTLDASGQPLLPITTFSIAMIHRQSGGKLPLFVEVRRCLTSLITILSKPLDKLHLPYLTCSPNKELTRGSEGCTG